LPPPSTDMNAGANDDVPVLIAGGSLVGLSTALFLGWHGIRSLVVERHPGTAIHPRAALFNQRTIELYRGLGLEREIVEASRREFGQNGAIVSVESLGGRELEYYFRHINDGVESLSPSPRLFITQIGLEPILRTRAEELGARLQYNTELVSFEAGADGVTAVVRERAHDVERTVRSQYLIAADGSRSPVRDRLGIALGGHGSFSNSITIYFRADIRPLVGDRNLSVIYVFGQGLQGFFRFSKAGDAGFLVVNKAVDANGELSANLWEDTSEERCVTLVREALGDPELQVELENVQRWNACADWAERFGDGRVFLAGDAAHNMPPTGGFGGNTGVQDGHNLAWKLALVLQGVAGPELLSTYDAERRPVGEHTVQQAYTRYVLRLAPELGKENLEPIVPESTVELGYRYRSAAVIADDQDGSVFENPHEPTGRPGTRAPHVALTRAGAPVSPLDLVGRDFVLLAGPAGAEWCSAAREAASDLGVGVSAYRIGEEGDVADDGGRFTKAYGIEADGAVLVRPDGFIAWRARAARDDSERVLADVLSRVLARPSERVACVEGE
jgi:2-polyprenyl-6-methoxyphenol hydroxylase-like FAD-dependent oxidoreductase